MIENIATYTSCLVCGRTLIPQQFALVDSESPGDTDDTILANESCPVCWEWARNNHAVYTKKELRCRFVRKEL
jgi:hypothetical protein